LPCADDSYQFLFGGAAVPNWLFVGIGGFIGSILRYFVSGYVQQITKSFDFPYGTLVVNLLGCLVIGFLSQLADVRGAFSAETRVLIFIGILGGFTTFSTFGNETMNLLRDTETLSAFANIGAHVILGLGAVWLGRILAYTIWS
jgi:CrcB protein